MPRSLLKILNRSFEEIKVGTESSFEVTVSGEEVIRFASLSGDYNPLHVSMMENGDISANGRHINHGMLLASYFSRLVGMYLPGRKALYLSQESRFIKPVTIGDRILIKGTITAKSDASRVITLKTEIYNQAKELVVDGKAEVLVREEIITEKKSELEISSSMNLDGKVILVTGASRGIGSATAKLLAKNGASVAVNYHQDEEGAQKVISEIKSTGGKGISFKANVADPVQVERMIETIQKQLGSVDILVNNAAPSFKPVSFSSLKWDQMKEQLDGVVKGAFLCIKGVISSMMERKNGRIINILSTYAFGIPPVQLTHYVTAKSALAGLSRSLAAELGPHGIQVNMIAPGMTETSLIDHVPTRFRDLYAYQAPLKRLAQPQDVAKTVLFLCSDLADFITGATLPVCGGSWMG